MSPRPPASTATGSADRSRRGEHQRPVPRDPGDHIPGRGESARSTSPRTSIFARTVMSRHAEAVGDDHALPLRVAVGPDELRLPLRSPRRRRSSAWTEARGERSSGSDVGACAVEFVTSGASRRPDRRKVSSRHGRRRGWRRTGSRTRSPRSPSRPGTHARPTVAPAAALRRADVTRPTHTPSCTTDAPSGGSQARIGREPDEPLPRSVTLEILQGSASRGSRACRP